MDSLLTAKKYSENYRSKSKDLIEWDFKFNKNSTVKERLLIAAFNRLDYIIIDRSEDYNEFVSKEDEINKVKREYEELGFRTINIFSYLNGRLYVKEWGVQLVEHSKKVDAVDDSI